MKKLFGCFLVAFAVLGCNFKELVSIDVVQNQTKSFYLQDEEFDKLTLTVNATYSDGSSQTVSGFTLSGFDSSVVGEKTLTVTYSEGKITQNASVTYYIIAKDALTPTPKISGKTAKFGDYPQTIARVSVTFTKNPIYNGWYVGNDGYFYEKTTENGYQSGLKYSDESSVERGGKSE